MKLYYLTITLRTSDGAIINENADINAYSFIDALKRYELYLLPNNCEITAAKERF